MPPQPKPKFSDVLTKRQIYNMSRGIGCHNCGEPVVRKYGKYGCCGSKGCARVLKSIWVANTQARKAGNA